MLGVIVCGAAGRMGSTLVRLVHESRDLKLVGSVGSRYPARRNATMAESALFACQAAMPLPAGAVEVWTTIATEKIRRIDILDLLRTHLPRHDILHARNRPDLDRKRLQCQQDFTATRIAERRHGEQDLLYAVLVDEARQFRRRIYAQSISGHALHCRTVVHIGNW